MSFGLAVVIHNNSRIIYNTVMNQRHEPFAFISTVLKEVSRMEVFEK